MNKRGAMAFFIIMALLLLFFIGFFVFIHSVSTPKMAEEDYSGYEGSEVEGYINNCLLQSTVRGLRRLGEQGGAIYKSQGGTTPLSSYSSLMYHGKAIYKGIRAGDLQPGKSCVPTHSHAVYNPQNCPSLAFPFKGTGSDEISFAKQWFPAPPTNWKERLRLFNRFTLPSIYPQKGVFTRMMSTYDYARGARGSYVYNDLKGFVEHDIQSCLDSLPNAFPNLDIEASGPPRAKPVISDDDVVLILNYPVKVSRDTKSLLEKDSFKVTTRIRLKMVYGFAWRLLNNEANNFSYDITSQTPPAGMSYRLQPVDPYSYLLIVNDSRSFVPKGLSFTPYVFYSAVEKSQPAISYIHYTDLDAVPGLHKNILQCPQYTNTRDNPFEETGNTLSAEIGTTLSRKSIECIWYAYKKSLNDPRWKMAYDPDGDTLNWSFKTAHCDWNQPCRYAGKNLYFDNYLALKFSDGVYEDFFNMSLPLYNHKPEVVWTQQVPIEDVMSDYIGSLGADVASALASLSAYAFIARDEDIYWGPDVDNLSYMVSPQPFSVWEQPDTENDERGWGVLWERPGGFWATITVTDKYGASASKRVYVT